jgi:hypothetical protein
MKTATQKTTHTEDLELVAIEQEKSRLATLLRKWQKHAERQLEIERRRDEELQPLRERFDKQAEPIVAAAEKELAPVLAMLADLDNEIRTALLTAIRPDGTVAIPNVEAKAAIAEVTIDQKREISPVDFFATVPAADRHSNFWNCLRVQIGETTNFLGKPLVSRLAKFKRTYDVTIRLR